MEYLLQYSRWHSTKLSNATILMIKLKSNLICKHSWWLDPVRHATVETLCQAVCTHPGVTGCSLEGDGPMAFDERETTATTAVVQQHEWADERIEATCLCLCLWQHGCRREGSRGGSRIGLEEMGLLLRRLNKSTEDKSDHICLVLFLVYLCTYGAENENKDYLNYYISDILSFFCLSLTLTLLS